MAIFRLWRQNPTAPAPPVAPALALAQLQAGPEGPICLIGDLHGRADLLALMLAEIRNRDPAGRARVVFLGDLIDRGPDSAEVLETVRRFCDADPGRRHCLMGNHERMLLDMLADPERAGPRWRAAGGEATLASFGCLARHGRDSAAEARRLAAALRAAMPPGLEAWIAARPLWWQTDPAAPGTGLRAAHAGSDARRPLAGQDETALLWGRRPDRGPAQGIEVQGHLIVPGPRLEGNRVWLDTGAYRTGRLSALWIAEGGSFLEVEGPGS